MSFNKRRFVGRDSPNFDDNRRLAVLADGNWAGGIVGAAGLALLTLEVGNNRADGTKKEKLSDDFGNFDDSVVVVDDYQASYDDYRCDAGYVHFVWM